MKCRDFDYKCDVWHLSKFTFIFLFPHFSMPTFFLKSTWRVSQKICFTCFSSSSANSRWFLSSDRVWLIIPANFSIFILAIDSIFLSTQKKINNQNKKRAKMKPKTHTSDRKKNQNKNGKIQKGEKRFRSFAISKRVVRRQCHNYYSEFVNSIAMWYIHSHGFVFFLVCVPVDGDAKAIRAKFSNGFRIIFEIQCSKWNLARD